MKHWQSQSQTPHQSITDRALAMLGAQHFVLPASHPITQTQRTKSLSDMKARARAFRRGVKLAAGVVHNATEPQIDRQAEIRGNLGSLSGRNRQTFQGKKNARHKSMCRACACFMICREFTISRIPGVGVRVVLSGERQCWSASG